MEVKPPFNLNIVSEAAALIALKSKAWLKKTVGIVVRERPKIAKSLTALGFKVYPSVTNFLLCKAPASSKKVCEGLAKRGILIKDFGNVPGLVDHVRITIGAPQHNKAFLEKLKLVLDENGVKGR
jgi:histidinol-phosphate aminotransferase